MLFEIAATSAGLLCAAGAWRYRPPYLRLTKDSSLFKLDGSDTDKPTTVLAEMVVLDMLKLDCSVREGSGYGNPVVYVKRTGRYDFTGRLRDGKINDGDLTIGGMEFDASSPEFKLVAKAVNDKVLPLHRKKQELAAEQARQGKALDILGSWVGGSEETPAPPEQPAVFAVDVQRTKLIEKVRAIRATASNQPLKL